MSVSDNRCRSCIYSSTMSETKPVTCDYILVTGNRRGCPPGEDCERYIKGKRAPSIDQQLYKGRKAVKKEPEKETRPKPKRELTPEQKAQKRAENKEYYQAHKKELNKRRVERARKQRQSP